MILSSKESSLLEDLKSQEKLCVEKYHKLTHEATDPQLKNLFSNIESTEKEHLDSIEKIISGTVPDISNCNCHKNDLKTDTAEENDSKTYATLKTDASACETDKYLCSDALASEKHVSSVYNTCIFEFKDSKVRDVLNHIQGEEQHHGEEIYNYMSSKGIYK